MTEARKQPSPLSPLVEAIEATEGFDDVAKGLAKKVRGVLEPGPLKDAITGTPLGHALHPMLTDVVIGSFVSATALDLLGGDPDGTAAERLIQLGIAAYPPTALTGTSDWADSEPGNDAVRRSGIAHAALNAAALSLYGASLAARKRGRRGAGKVLGLLGAGALGAGGYLGGHLVFAKGIGPDQTVFDPGPDGWTDAMAADELSQGQPARVVVGDTPVLLLLQGRSIRALHDRCSHRGCSLADGSIEGDAVVCACHGSRFALADGRVLRGPASHPQPHFQARRRSGRVEVRLAAAD